MANDSFATFAQVSALDYNDFLVGYRNISETRISYAGLVTTFTAALSTDPAKVNSVYTTVNTTSANNASVYTTVNATSSLISLSATGAENILVLGNSVTVLSAVGISTVSLVSPVSAFVVQINGINYRFLAYQ
jgi:hypothetical protein